MHDIVDQTITGQNLRIDDTRFVRCTLIDCTLEYSGQPAMFEHTVMRRCKYTFFAEAKHTVLFLQGVGLMPRVEGEWDDIPEDAN